MLDLVMNFKSRVEKEHNLIEAICISNSEGIILSEHYMPRTVRNIYSHSKSFTSLMVGISLDEGKLTFSVTSSNINKVLNYKDLVVSSDAEFELSFTNKKISNIKIMLVTASNKNVEVNISYLY